MSKPGSTRPREATGSTRGHVHTIHYELSYIAQNMTDPEALTVVLLHGFPGDAALWNPVLAALGTTPAVAFDLLGYGQSDHPWPADASVWGHADALNLALRQMDLRQVILVGFDLGGGVAQVLATRLAADLVRGLVLIDSTAFQMAFSPDWPLPEMEKRQDPEAPHHTAISEIETALRQTIPLGSADPASISGAILDAYVTPWLNELGKECLFQQIRGMVPVYQNSVGSDLAYLTCPTLIVWGELDTIIPMRWGQHLHRTIPGSRLRTIPDVGHLVLNDAPDAVGRLVADFVG